MKPHKKGRTALLPNGRCTPDDLTRLKKILVAKSLSYADWVAGKIKREKI